MTTREQLTHERLEALIETLEANGVISRDFTDALEATSEFNEGRAVSEAAREGGGPPDFSNGNP